MDSMRPILAILVALAALTAASAGSSASPAVSLIVTPAAPTSPGGRGALGLRNYSVSFRVNVAADQECANLVVTYDYAALFDGRPSFSGSASDYYETKAPASSASFDAHAAATAGDVVTFSARGECEDADGNVVAGSAPVAAKAVVPAQSCAEGPTHVFAAKGASRQDLVDGAKRVPVRAGHSLWSGYRVWVAKRGRITYGAAACHGLRLTVVGPATFIPGDYARGSYGASAKLGYGALASFRGDQHSGGIETANAAAVPRGKPSAPSKVARFDVLSYPKRSGLVTRVRVRSGRVYVAGRISRGRVVYSAPLVAKAGQTVFVRCSRGACRPALG